MSFWLHGISGDAGRPDMLGQWFVDDPVGVIAKGVSEAQLLGLRYMIGLPAGYDRATAGPHKPDGTSVLMNSNLSLAMMPAVFAAIAGNPGVVALYDGYHAARNWRDKPNLITTMPMEKDAQPLSAADRRKWARINLSPLQAASNIRYWAFDGSQGDPAGLAVVEAELRRDEVADVYGEIAPTVPDSSRANGLKLNTAVMLKYPSIGWVTQWDFAVQYGLHDSAVPTGIESCLIWIPRFEGGFTPDHIVNLPDLNQAGLAKGRGWRLGVGSGASLDQYRAFLSVPPLNPATDPA